MVEIPSDLQLFTGRHTRPPGIPRLNIQSKGVMSLGVTAYEALGEPKAVQLLFSPSANVIVLKAVEVEDPNSFPLRRIGPKGRTWLIGARSFLLQNEVPFEGKSVSFHLHLVDGQGLVQLTDIPDMVPNGSGGK